MAAPTKHQQEDPENSKPGWKKFLAYAGPGFLVSLAYLDPGNLETDLQAGANHRYELLWVILIGLIFALIIQSLAANLGVVTGKHLAELCSAEYPTPVKYGLWLLAEVAVIAADIPEVIGFAFALNILFQIPVWAGVLLTGFSTLLLLGLQRYGIRKLELLISTLVFVMAGCFFGELSYVKPPAKDVLKGMFVPKLQGIGATGDAIALTGALIMPHNLFLHSALVLSRKGSPSVKGINNACRYFLMESGIALFIAFLINIAVVSVSGTVCSVDYLSKENSDRCSDLTLNSASFLLQNVLGKSSSKIYAIALLASGQSSAITGTYAGQYVMQGFLDLKMKAWARNLITRSVSIVPSLIVSIISGSSGSGRLIVIASMILSFELPFALIPLLKFSSSKTKMGPLKNSIYIIVFSWILGFCIIGINVYYLISGFIGWLIHSNLPKIIVISWILGFCIIGINVYYLISGFLGWLIHSNLPKVANIFIGILVFPLMAAYILAVVYLTLREDKVETFIDTTSKLEAASTHDCHSVDQVPYREDLADIPLPL